MSIFYTLPVRCVIKWIILYFQVAKMLMHTNIPEVIEEYFLFLPYCFTNTTKVSPNDIQICKKKYVILGSYHF